MSASNRRFRVAFSFPGEYRKTVEQVAEYVAQRVGREKVLYDAWYEAEFARLDLDEYLQNLYHNESDLIAVFLCANYEKKRWCRLEWRAIRDLIATDREGRIMFLRFDDGDVSGLFQGDGYADIRDQSPADIADLILERLGHSSPRLPDTHASAESLFRHAPSTLFGRKEELEDLDAAWRDSKTHVLSLVGWGGIGKTSLVANWMTTRDVWSYRDFERVFAWSFYSQGTRKEGAPSAEQFTDRALRFFADPDPSSGSQRDKGQRLAHLVGQSRCLLVLDGLEPLQYPPGPLAGRIRDDAVTALLTGLAQRNNGLCVVTTREQMTDLEPFRNTTAPVVILDDLSPSAGVELLTSKGVQGAETELRRLVKDVSGHALTLTLIGTYLDLAHHGDIRKRSNLRLKQASDEQGGHAFQVMETYERWLASNDAAGEKQVAALRLVGLFDRPVDAHCLAALRNRPAISGLTEPLVDLSEEEWNIHLRYLERCGLISLYREDSAVGSGMLLDAHALVREYFADKLREENPTGRSEAHGRLFDHLMKLTGSSRRRPTLEDTAPLFHALMHGCEANRLREALDVYRQRILMGEERLVRYTLGAFGSQVAALFYFVDPELRSPAPQLSPDDGAFVLSQLGFCLRSLTLFGEAQEWMRAALDAYRKLKNWKQACDSAAILCHLYTTTGHLDMALHSAQESVKLADKSRDPHLRTIMRMTRGNVYHYLGNPVAARRSFRNAEKMKPEMESEESRLRYTLRLFHYHDFLLTEGKLDEVISGAREALKVQLPGRQSELNQGLHSVSLGLALLLKAQRGDRADLVEAQHYLDQALIHLRNADREDDLPYALTARADVRRQMDNLAGSRDDLEEADLVTSRAQMRRLAAHCQLSFARLHLATGDRSQAVSSWREAQRLVDVMGYRRLEKDADEIRKLLGVGRLGDDA